ncbi:hypothetical protein L915_19745 [Phytophthora nicotianae]|uniref:Uncharacterized protein n=1 Tax=Phytophthora nicotianae TaxID=4792 RepID=W2FR78_PHYNI|nr:hypothetical protein L915_19745 [Phytophthora nicotianae]
MSITQRPDSEKHETKTGEVFTNGTKDAVGSQSVTNDKYAEQRNSQDTDRVPAPPLHPEQKRLAPCFPVGESHKRPKVVWPYR